ncbi:Endonuclease/exonuclease/phosphatase [Lentinula raphanica]|nr:Endonuclease/exonuclease/phosphatase [Lentinula raphanica]
MLETTNTHIVPQTPIRFAQLNANKKKAPVMALLNDHINDYNIIFIQEPNWSFIGKEGDRTILGTVNHATAWTPISPIPSAPDTVTPRVYAYVKISLQAEVTLRTDIVSDRDIMVLDIKPRKGKKVTYIHVYNDPSLGRQQAMWRLRNFDLTASQAMVVTGDMNLHHIRWSRGEPRSSTITDEIVEWMDQNLFALINKPREPTHYPHDTGKHPSVIDLTWVNTKAAEVDATQEWAIDQDLMTGSDHVGIRWRYDPGQAQIENPLGVKYNLKKVKPAEWIKAFDEEVEKLGNRLTPITESVNITRDQLDDAAEALTKAMQNATEKVAQVRRPSPHRIL